ncbi:mitochondrial substrate carrier family protein [Tieghemostelium lacteum]|uniref:Mitochondrial substrate carrier family protein n=1 Tax=Tieghemostelium lacteum TaxID=361077 RepID=A0A151ZDP6_TIELA|nr:mitochondrial substrate carrier family protein [Tieghemostelium lacteum]|eukprot:KYQ92061.1 mitochondrial substrate carrier family protein [Tieghemostelium lacteum]
MSNQQQQQNSIIKLPPYVDGISAALGSTVAILILQPFDLLKIRLQGSGFGLGSGPSDSKYQRPKLIPTVRGILKNEGVSQFWRGIGPTIVANGVAWGVYMYSYETYKNILKQKQSMKENEHLSLQQNFMCALSAGITQVFFTNPIFLIKTRMQLQAKGSNAYYTGFFDGVSKTVKNEGFKGLYKGVVPGLWLTLHGGIQMSVYDEIKFYFRNNGNTLNSQYEIFVASSISKLLASSILYPFQLIKTRLQDERNIPKDNKTRIYNGTIDTAKKIFKSEGIAGFYRGLIPNTLKVIPNSSITLMAYEEIKQLIAKNYYS